MTRVLVIIPTFNHTDTLRYSIASALSQTHQNLEIVVIGDGAPDVTGSIVDEFSQQDSRVQFQAFPSSPRTGESWRDDVIRQSDADIVAYLSDDDLWAPWHLQHLAEGLEDADFIHSPHVLVGLDGGLRGFMFNAASASLRARMSAIQLQCFGLTFPAHTREAYLQLENGWESTPWGINTDVFMWSKWASDPRMRLATSPVPSGLHFHAVLRRLWRPDQRISELDRWQPVIGAMNEPSELAARCDWREYFSRVLVHHLNAGYPDLDDALEELGITLGDERQDSCLRYFMAGNQRSDLETLWATHTGNITEAQANAHWRQGNSENGPEKLLFELRTGASNERLRHCYQQAAESRGTLAQLVTWRTQIHRLHATEASVVADTGSRTDLTDACLIVDQLIKQGHLPQAKQLISRLLKKAPRDSTVRLVAGQFLLRVDQPALAVQMLEGISRERPSDLQAHLYEADAMLKANRLAAVDHVLGRMHQGRMQHPDRTRLEALLLKRRGKDRESRNWVREGLSRFPGAPQLRALRSDTRTVS